jgi:hypothetical protein
MAAELTRLNHKIAIQLHLVAESCTICNSRSKRPVRKLLDTHVQSSALEIQFRPRQLRVGLILVYTCMNL